MNAPHPLYSQLAVSQPTPVEPEEGIDLLEFWDMLVDSRWLILMVTALALAMGIAYAYLARPIYEANLLVQVEDASSSARSILGDAASLVDGKTPATAEIEILRSRMVLGQAVDKTLLYIDAKPRYLPLVGNWMARRAHGLSEPGFMGLRGYVSGTESISAVAFSVPTMLEGTRFRLTAAGGGRYVVTHPELEMPLTGQVGLPLVRSTPEGTISLHITELTAKPGAEFDLTRRSRLSTIEALQKELQLSEKGRQSGVIEAGLQSPDPAQLAMLLNEIGTQYVRQNIERKAAEAQKSLAFLDVQMPQLKRQLEIAEEAYNKYRNQQGTVALDEETKLILNRTVDLQSKMLDAQQRRRELASRFTGDHPSVKTLDEQIRAWSAEIGALNHKVRDLPTVQQDALRLERDVKVNNELYQQLRNNSLQLQLVKEGKIGNVRLIDEAVPPESPVQPKRMVAIGISLAGGLLLALLLAVFRNTFFRGIRNPQEIEARLGLNVFSTIPLSPFQVKLARKVAAKEPGLHLLAHMQPQDPAVESLRSLRTALQFAMLQATDNRVLITGATPGVGKSFVSANFAALLASAGKRVLLIDSDLRKGYLNHYFGLPRAGGLSEVIAGTQKFAEVVRHNVLPNLDLMTTGVLPPNPAELMMSASFGAFLDAVSTRYDLVLIDTPPILAAADTYAIANQAGTLLLVARSEETQLGELHECSKRLEHAGRVINGVLFNAMDLSRRHYGGYGYRYNGYRYKQYNY